MVCLVLPPAGFRIQDTGYAGFNIQNSILAEMLKTLYPSKCFLEREQRVEDGFEPYPLFSILNIEFGILNRGSAAYPHYTLYIPTAGMRYLFQCRQERSLINA
jgi:hypothetical protein